MRTGVDNATENVHNLQVQMQQWQSQLRPLLPSECCHRPRDQDRSPRQPLSQVPARQT